MTKKSGKSVSFDAMIKFFMMRFEIPTRQDIQKLIGRIDQLEKTIRVNAISEKMRQPQNATKSTRRSKAVLLNGAPGSASAFILEAIRNSEEGMTFAEIQTLTGFDDKKIRNILHRLHKIGKIVRKRRGLYVVES